MAEQDQDYVSPSPEVLACAAQTIQRYMAEAIAQRHLHPPAREYTAQAADANRRRAKVGSGLDAERRDEVIREAQEAGLNIHPVITPEKANEIVQHAVGSIHIHKDPERGKLMTANGVTYIIAAIGDLDWDPFDDGDDEEQADSPAQDVQATVSDLPDPRELFKGDKILVNGTKMEVVQYVWGLHDPPVIVCQSGRNIDPTVEPYQKVSGAFDAAQGMIGD